MRIAVFGLGYVGTVTAAGLASCGHEVIGVDVDSVKVDNINAGLSPVVEPGIDELLATAVRDGLLTATTDPVVALDRADVSLLCVGTPSMPQGGTNLAYMRRALEDIRQAMSVATPPASGFHAVVVRSTVPPGTGDEVVRRGLPRHAAGDRGLDDRDRHVSGVPPRGLRRRRLLQPAVRRAGHGRPAGDRGDDRALLLPGPRDQAGRCTQRRGAEVRLQRLPCHQDLLRQRDGPHLPDVRSRLPGGDEGLQRGHGAQHLPGLPGARIRLRRFLPAQGPAVAAGHGSGERARCPAAVRHPALQRARHPRRRRPADRQPVPDGRHAGPELQDEHRRPTREPQRRVGGTAARQGLRRPDL